jgi:hypothetical protein
LFPHEGHREGLVAQGVDGARVATGFHENPPDGLPREGNLLRSPARYGQPVKNILTGFTGRERGELRIGGNALPDLAELRGLEFGVQFRLPDQEDLDQLFLFGFEVGDHPDLLQRT